MNKVTLTVNATLDENNEVLEVVYTPDKELSSLEIQKILLAGAEKAIETFDAD